MKKQREVEIEDPDNEAAVQSHAKYYAVIGHRGGGRSMGGILDCEWLS